MSRRLGLPLLLLLLVVGVTGCGSSSAPPEGAGKPASINLSLTTVPYIRSVNVTPSTGKFANCLYGSAANWTPSTLTKLGYPNGRCWFGHPSEVFPITITNTGIASDVLVSGSSAVPSDGGDQWSLCNIGSQATVACTHDDGLAPGVDQYRLVNFGPDGRPNFGGLTDNPVCDYEFASSDSCWASHNAYQTEGVEIIGPESPTDVVSTSWTVTITWMPVPP
jgi:hypothetical protein